jgi:tetratricopeptide (TPR) repeat protein
LKSGDARGALVGFDEILSRNPRNHVARNGKIEALVKLELLDEAESEAMAAIAAAETDPDASVMLLNRAQRALATIYWKQGKNREAEIAYELSEQVRKTDESAAFMPGPNVTTPEGAAEALRMIDTGLAKNPGDPVALSARFELSLKAGKREEALATAERLAELGVGNVQTLFQAGKLLQDEQRYEPAIACFTAALERTGPQPEILGHLATAQIAAGRLDEAERALVTADELQPADPRPQFYLGNIALLRNQEQKAREHFDEALRRDPKWTEPLDNLALWLLANGRAEEAVGVLEDALGRNPEDPKAREMLARVRRGGAAPASTP